MLPQFCEAWKCFFGCEIIFNRHNKKFHSTITQTDVDNSVRLSDGDSQANFDLDLSEDEDDFKRSYKFGFWNLEMCDQMKKWSGNKLKKQSRQCFSTSHLYLEPCHVTLS